MFMVMVGYIYFSIPFSIFSFFFFMTGIELLHTRESTLGSLFEKLALFSMHGRF